MSKSKPFVVPEGVVFQIEDDGVTIENAGDIVLHTNFGGRALKRIVSREGDVELHGAVNAAELHAAGSLRTHGDTTVAILRAGGNVEIEGDASLADIVAGGTLRVSGNAELGGAELAAGLEVGGKLSAGHLRVAGSATLGGDASAKSIGVGSDLTIGGGLQCGPVQAGGTISVAGATAVGGMTSGATVALAGAVVAGTITAHHILLSGQSIQARGLQGAVRVVIGAAKVTVDAIIAPQVELDPKTSGRVTVIELQNELGANAVKGGFRLADYGEMFGNPEGFLAERGLVPLGESPGAPGAVDVAAPPAPALPAAVEAPSEPRPAPDHEADGGETDATEAPAGEAEVVEAEVVEAEMVEAEEPDAAATVSVPVIAAPDGSPHTNGSTAVEPADDAGPDGGDEHATGEPARVAIPAAPILEVVRPVTDPWAAADQSAAPPTPAAAEPPTLAKATSMHDDDPLAHATEHPMHGQLSDTVQRIVECYAGQDVPPAVEKLRELVAARQYPQIRAEITNIWSELLKFHQKKGMRIQHQVTTTFNSVNGLVKKM